MDLEKKFAEIFGDEKEGQQELFRILSSRSLEYKKNDLEQGSQIEANPDRSPFDWITKRIEKAKAVLELWEEIEARHSAVESGDFQTSLEAHAYMWQQMGDRNQTEYIDSDEFKRDYPRLKEVIGDKLTAVPLSGMVHRSEIKKLLKPGSELSYYSQCTMVGTGGIGTTLKYGTCSKVAKVNITLEEGWKIRIDQVAHIWIGDERYGVLPETSEEYQERFKKQYGA